MLDNEGVLVQQIPRCPVCGGSGHPLYEGLRDRYFGAPGQWSFFQCGGCLHLWLNPAPVRGDVQKLYPSYWEHYDSHFCRKGSEPSQTSAGALFERANRAALFALGYEEVTRTPGTRLVGKALTLIPPLREILEGTVMSLRGPAVGHLLDVGCGDGSFLRFMRSLGWQVTGLEPDAEAARLARERHGLTVTQADIEDANLPEDAYDAITMQHVIEHVLNPVKVLKTVFRWLRPGGVLVIRTPNALSWGHRVFGQSWMPLEPPRHLHLFSPDTLRTCVERAGFLIEDVHTSARIAQGVFDDSNAIASGGPLGSPGGRRRRSFRSRAFILAEMVLSLVDRNAGEEIVLLATRSRGSTGSRLDDNAPSDRSVGKSVNSVP